MSRISVEKNISFDDVKNLFYVTLDYGKNEVGKRIKKTKTFLKKSEAKKALKMFEADKTKGTLVLPSEQTVETFLLYWLEDIKSMNCEESTLYGYRNIINRHLIPALGEYKLQDLTPMILNIYFKEKSASGLKNVTIRKHYDLLKHSLNTALNEERILKNPLDKIQPIKSPKEEKNFYSIKQLQSLFDIVNGDRMEVVVKLAGMLGLRRSEILGLKWEYINFTTKQLTIKRARTQVGSKTVEKRTKNQSSHRTLSIPDEIFDLLVTIKENQENQKLLLDEGYKDNGFIIAWENGKPYRPNYISDLFKKIIDNNNLPYLKLHDLRHTFASIANDLGISLFDISKALGHSQVGTTSNIYTHMFDKTHKKAVDKISSALEKKKQH